MEVGEELSCERKYQKLTEHSSSTIQVLEEQSEKMNSKESLRALQVDEPTAQDNHRKSMET